MSSEQKIFTVGPAPHWRTKSSITKTNYAFLLALMPAAIVSAFSQPGFSEIARVIGLLALGAGTGLLTEYIIQLLMRQPYHATNGHGALMGLIFVMILPLTVPWWLVVLGVILSILVGKQIYGGIGGYPFHPAMVGYLIVLLSYSNLVYPIDMKTIAAAQPVIIYLTIVGGVVLLFLRHIKWQIPVAVIIGVLISSAIFKFVYPDMDCPLTQLMSGHVMLAAFFLATDSTSSPANRIPMWIFGIGVGVMIMLIRVYGVWPDAIPFAVMLMNILNPLIDRIRPRPKEMVIQNG